MVHASLFSGIGGPEVAAAMLGWTNAFHCEINPFGRQVLEYWFPDSVSYEDITKTDFNEWRGRIDVLTGGFPCQPFSYAGKRKGEEDERYLWPEMLRVIDEIRPTWVVGENVAGLTTLVEGGVLTYMGSETTLFGEEDTLHGYMLRETFTIERICRDLEHIGYSVQPVLIPAAAVGAPHRRDRIFILARNVADTDGNGCGAPAAGRRADGFRPLQRASENAVNLRRGQRADEVMGHQQGQGNARPTGGDGETELNTSDSDGKNIQRLRDGSPEGHGKTEAGSVGQSCRTEPIAYPDCAGLQEPQQPGRREDSQEEGAGMDDRTVRPCSDGRHAADTKCQGLEGEDEPRSGEGRERMRVRRDTARYDWATDESLLPENRWRHFPTVSPVHGGNDGLPFPVDDLTIPFSKWRTESLKAYGNSMVVGVMYTIFKAIKDIEDGTVESYNRI